jgi:hypothetical protein
MRGGESEENGGGVSTWRRWAMDAQAEMPHTHTQRCACQFVLSCESAGPLPGGL